MILPKHMLFKTKVMEQNQRMHKLLKTSVQQL